MSTPVLSVATREPVEPASIAINDTAYRLRSKDDLTWAQTIRMSELRVALHVAREKIFAAGATETDEAAFAAVIRDLLILAVDAPQELLLALHRDHQLAIVSAAFFGYRPPAPPTEIAPGATAATNATN
jgi:hypothetical protein